MQRLLMGGTVAGVMGMFAVAAFVVITGTAGGQNTADQAVAAPPAAVPTVRLPSVASSPSPSMSQSESPNPSMSPSESPNPSVSPAGTTEPPRSAQPTRTTAKPSPQPERLDADGAARVVRAAFTGAEVIEIEFDDGLWEVTFTLRGVGHEIRVNPGTGRLSGHEVDDD